MREPARDERAQVDLRQVHARMKAVAGVARLALNSGRWSGVSGSVLGQGTGSSIDFHDQRPYLPGDDPRHINWQAYARSGAYTMKLYRQEVTPRVDVLFDSSASMFLTEAKALRSWELLYFCVESALRLGAAVKVWQLGANGMAEASLERVLGDNLAGDGGTEEPMAKAAGMLAGMPLRGGALRVWISDLLYEENPAEVVAGLLRERGKAMILAPHCVEESKPDWQGNLEFERCEGGRRERRRVERGLLERYERAYGCHFAMWREACARRGVGMARIAAAGDFLGALREEALMAGVELA